MIIITIIVGSHAVCYVASTFSYMYTYGMDEIHCYLGYLLYNYWQYVL